MIKLGDNSGSRNAAIDILRAFGLLCIILAHVNAPKWLLEFRSFDVPLLTFIAGLSFTLSTNNQTVRFFQYFTKRIKKLLIPTWIVLIAIFVVTFFACRGAYPFSKPIIIESFLLFDGIGYVWFVRVTLMLAVMSPFLAKLNSKIKNEYIAFAFIILWILTYIATVWFYKNVPLPRVFSLILYHVVIFFGGYGFIYYIGMYYSSMKKKHKDYTFAFSLVIFIICLIRNGVSITDDKYPPGVMFISYGLCVSFLLFFALDRLNLRSVPIAVSFLSRNSFMVYLMHIPPILFLKYSDGGFASFIKSNFILEYLFLLALSVLMTVLLNYLKKVCKRREKT